MNRDNATGDLFDAPNKREHELREEMMRRLRAPWGQSPPRIPEPSDAEKIAYCDAFVRSSAPRPAP